MLRFLELFEPYQSLLRQSTKLAWTHFAEKMDSRHKMTMWSAIVRPGPCRICPDPKISAIPVKLTFCWVIFKKLFVGFLNVSCLRWKKNRQLKYPLMSLALRFRVIVANSTEKTLRAKQFILEHIDEELRAQSGLNCNHTLLERMSFSVTVFRNIGTLWNTHNIKCSQMLRMPNVDKCCMVQLVAIHLQLLSPALWRQKVLDAIPDMSVLISAF